MRSFLLKSSKISIAHGWLCTMVINYDQPSWSRHSQNMVDHGWQWKTMVPWSSWRRGEADDSEAAQQSSQFLYSYLESCNEDQLSDFLTFVTGTGYETSALVLGSINVSFRNTDANFSSTCLMDIKIPTHFKSQAQFNTVFGAVIQGQAFNTH